MRRRLLGRRQRPKRCFDTRRFRTFDDGPSALAGGMRALISVDDLTAGGKPDGIVLLHLGDRPLQIFDAQGLAGDHGMERNAHDSRLLLAVGQQRLELIEYGTEKSFPVLTFMGYG